MSWLPLAPLLAAAAAYATGVWRLRRRGDPWPARRSALLGLGLGVLAVALLPPLAARDEQFGVHAAQHVLLTAVAPLLLVRSAPVVLALRTLAPRPRRLLLRVLHGRAVRLLLRTPVVLALQVCSAYALYLTPLFGLAERHPALHALVHAHVVAVGVLFAAWAAGLDPLPGRPPVRTRLAGIAAAAAAHDVLCHTMYARGLPAGADAPEALRTGAQLMYYAAGAVELALAAVLLGDWWARGSRELRRAHRRAVPAPGGAPSPAGRGRRTGVLPSA